jgi:serine/threonine protein kinase
MPEDPVDPVAPTPPPEAEEPTYPSLEELAQLLPQYEIHEIIGIGGMGAVYKGRQIALDRLVAIKVMPAASAQNPEDVQRFIKEARSMAKLVHPHIVAVFDFGQTYARHLFLVMEYERRSPRKRRVRSSPSSVMRSSSPMTEAWRIATSSRRTSSSRMIGR